MLARSSNALITCNMEIARTYRGAIWDQNRYDAINGQFCGRSN